MPKLSPPIRRRRHAAFQRAVAPGPVHRLATGFFSPDAPTADIGCGAGRDTAWLESQGFPTVGYEPSAAMRAEAQAHYPGIRVSAASLPDSTGCPTRHTPMCLQRSTHASARRRSDRRRRRSRPHPTPRWTPHPSFRGPRGGEEREDDGRLFTPIDPGRLVLLLESVGLAVLHRETTPDASRPDVLWHALVAERGPLDVARGLERIQGVLAQDRKVATYKFALIRALCVISAPNPTSHAGAQAQLKCRSGQSPCSG